ncbi:MAG TPA: HXXEE domain-containing protein [Thermoanaerobaculia bacterium]|nr:HXXEE domain-containing protein [Thermoanaerobaculia bacterium]
MTWHHRGAPSPQWWLLLLPVSFLLHIAEEWWAGEGFAAWTARAVGTPIGTTRFLVVNSIAWPLFTLLTVLAVRRNAFAWFPTTFATIVLVNAALHILGTLATATYSPGLVTSLALYLPIGGLAFSAGRRQLAARSFALAVLTGVVIHSVVILIALA